MITNTLFPVPFDESVCPITGDNVYVDMFGVRVLSIKQMAAALNNSNAPTMRELEERIALKRLATKGTKP